LALRQFVAGVQSVAGVHDYKMCGHLPHAPRRSTAPSQGDGGILVKRALVMFLFESVKLKSYEEDYFLTEKGPHKIPHFAHSTEKSRDDMFFLFL
jgi:hypothetical protein